MEKRTYKDFGEAIEELRQEARVSYDRIAYSIMHPQSYVYGLCTKRKRNLPKYEQIKEFADYFNVSMDYFYEYRLRKMLEFVDEDRKFLDHCEKEAKKWAKAKRAVKQNEDLEEEKKEEEAV
jgi:transcriptional regulator with XRE-family HTH domain